MYNAKSRAVPLLLALMLAFVALPRAFATFSSIYVFGDGVCTTTQSPSPLPAYLYDGARYCNGPVWIEKISTLQGVPYDAAKNRSFFNHHSAVLKTSVNNFSAPADAEASLFIVWSNDADFVVFAGDNALWQSNSQSSWDTKINTAISDLTTAINTLYAKGARKIVMPNAANIAAIPLYSGRSNSEKSFFRDRVMQYNTQFQTATTDLMNSKSGLVIYRPDVFSYFEQVIANPGSYGFTNASSAATVVESDKSFTGPGANYVFWDYWHPTTKFQDLLANFVNQSIPAPPPSDTTPPELTLPGNLVREATGPGGAVVTFETSANDDISFITPTTNTPASGSTFPVGNTTVDVSASDEAGNTSTGSFTVTVVNMTNLLQNVSITPAGTGSPSISGQVQGGPPNGQVILQASADLGSSAPWRDIQTINLDADGNQSFGPVTDPEGQGLTRDFFRIKLPLSP